MIIGRFHREPQESNLKKEIYLGWEEVREHLIQEGEKQIGIPSPGAAKKKKKRREMFHNPPPALEELDGGQPKKSRSDRGSKEERGKGGFSKKSKRGRFGPLRRVL